MKKLVKKLARKILKKEILAKEEIISSKSNFSEWIWCGEWIDAWKDYFIENHALINNKINLLKYGLDDISIKTIDFLIELNINFLPRKHCLNAMLFNKNKLNNFDELKDNLDISLVLPDINFLIPEEFQILEEPVWVFDNGLKFLDKEITDRIQNKDIIDCGAFWGDSSLSFLKYKPYKVYAIEPCSKNFEALKNVIRRNNLENVIVPYKKGVYNQADTRILYHNYEGLENCSSFYNNSKNENLQESIELITIDKLVQQNNINPAVIKMDIEGAELEAVYGAAETVRTFKPIMLISVYHRPDDLFEIKPFLSSLNPGYKFKIRKLHYSDPLIEVSLIAY